MKKYKIFVINPGSTSTKLALFENETCVLETCISHYSAELLKFRTINEQLPLRMRDIREFLKKDEVDLTGLDAVAARGGGSYSMESGTYLVDERLIEDTRESKGGIHHPSSLGVQMAKLVHDKYGGEMYTVNPPVVDEFCDLARVTGLDGVYRKSRLHALNMKEMAIRHAKSLGRRYEDCNFIVCHIDGGITVSAHDHGRIVDANDGSGGDGPMTPTRIGSIALTDIVPYLKGKDLDAFYRTCVEAGGFVSLMGSSDADALHEKIKAGDKKAARIWDAMIYQIAKEIGSMSAVLHGRVDAILLGGRLLRFPDLEEKLRDYCGWIAPVTAYEGEFEQEALAFGALKVLRGEEKAKRYTGAPVWDGFHD